MKIPVQITRIMPDRTQYKMYSIEYSPENLFVDVEIDDEGGEKEILDIKHTEVHLNFNGLAELVGKLADLPDRIQDEHIMQMKKGK